MSQDVLDAARRAREASHGLALATRAQKDAALLAMADALLARWSEVLDANADDVTRAEADGTPANIVDRLRLTPQRLEDMARGLRDVAAPARPGRRGGPRRHARQRAGAAPGAGAVRRGRDDLRGPAQRDRRRRRDLPQVRQRRAAPRLVVRAGPATPRSWRCCATPPSRPASTADVVQLVPGDSHDSVKALMRARGLVDVLDPARGSGADPLGGRGVDGAGDRDRRRQLPRLRRPRGRPRQGARDRAQRQDPAHQRLQRRRVAAGARRRRARRSCRGWWPRCRTPA